jgi:hypothetical protein
LDLDDRGVREMPRVPVTLEFGGEAREDAGVRVPDAMATALVVGLLQVGSEGPFAVAELVHTLYQRDRLPDLDKTVGWKRGRVVELAEAALDLVEGP